MLEVFLGPTVGVEWPTRGIWPDDLAEHSVIFTIPFWKQKIERLYLTAGNIEIQQDWDKIIFIEHKANCSIQSVRSVQPAADRVH